MDSSLVYSTTFGRMCPLCEQPVAQCVCRKQHGFQRGNGAVRVSRETKGRKGKCITLITGLPVGSDKLLELARLFKRKCGSGGTVRDGIVEIQGDQRDLLVRELIALGYGAKKAGG